MPDLPEVVQRYTADVDRYVRDVVDAAHRADQFGERNSEAALAARRMGLAASEAADKAARAQRKAAEEAEKLARGEGNAEKAAQAAARAMRDLERADIAQTRASQAAARAADSQADQYRQLAREAAIAGGAQRLAQLRAAGATEDHDRLLAHLRGQFGDLGRDGSGAFEMMGDSAEKSGGVLSKLGGGPLPLIAAGLGALPWAASLAGSAITVGLGAAIVGIGIKAAASNAKVKAAYSDLGKHVKDQAKTWAKPFEDTLIKTASFARRTFDELGPDIADSWRELAPVVTAFADDFMHSLEEFRPAIHDVTEAVKPLLSEFGERAPALMGRLADMISRVAKASDAEMFGRFLDGLGLAITAAGHAVSILSGLANVFYKFGPISIAARNLDNFGRGLDNLRSKAFGGRDAVDSYVRSQASVRTGSALAAAGLNVLSSQTGTASGQMGTMSGAMKLASQTADQLKASFDRLAGKTLSARAAARDYQQAVDDATASVKENGRTLNINTQAGRNNQAALDNLAVKAQAQAVAFRDSKKSAEEVAKGMSEARRRFISTSIAMGDTRKHAQEVADKLFGVRNAANKIPPRKGVTVTANTAAARAALNAFLADFSNRVIPITASIAAGIHSATGGYIGYAKGGPVQGFPNGGPVRGPGTGTSDSIPAWLSNKEFVINAKETAKWRPLLEAVNSGVLSRMAANESTATLQSMASHASAPVGAGSPSVVQNVVNIDLHIAGTVVSEYQLIEQVRAGLAGISVLNPGRNGATVQRAV